MTVPGPAWFGQLQDKLNSDKDYLQDSRWLMGAVLLRIGEKPFTVYFHKGRIIEVEAGAALTGCEFAIVGPEDAWDRLIRGEVEFPRSLTATGLRIEGDAVKAAGNMHALCRFFKIMSTLPLAEVTP